MNLFGIRSKRQNKDLREEDIPKRGFFVFLDVYFGKFMKFMQVNFLMLGVNLLYLALLFWISPINASTFEAIAGYESVEVRFSFDLLSRILFALFVVLFWGGGPVSAGISYIFRCYASRQHAWIISDFKDKLVENFVQGIIVMLIDVAVLIVFPYAMRFYWAQYVSTQMPFHLVLIGVLCVFLIFYTFMHYFMYQMMVRFECKLKEIYKNALILTVMKFPVLLIVTVIAVSLFIIPAYFLGTYSLLLFMLFLMSLIRFILEFYASRVIEDVIEPEDGKEKIIDHDRKWHR